MFQFRCGCGELNYNQKDWLSHFQHNVHGNKFWRGLRNLALTRIEFKRARTVFKR